MMTSRSISIADSASRIVDSVFAVADSKQEAQELYERVESLAVAALAPRRSRASAAEVVRAWTLAAETVLSDHVESQR